MNCKKIFTRDFLSDNCTNVFIIKNLKIHRENILLDRQKCLLPATQPYLVIEKERKKIDLQVREIMKEQEQLTRLIAEKHDQIRNLQTVRRNLRLEITGEAGSSSESEVKKFIRKCPMNECRGFLSSRWKCGTCDTNICNKCNEPKIDDHVCDPKNVETLNLINKDTKPCPKCGTMICKLSGCDQMWCPDCHTAFSWNRGTIEKGVVHNPHYYEFQRSNNNGVIPRNPGDIPCGGLPDYYTIRAVTDDVRCNALHQTITHILNVEIRRYNNVQEEELINRDLRIKYLMNEINDEQLKQVLQQNEKSRQKMIDFRNIYQMFCDVGSDIFRQILAEYYKISLRNRTNEQKIALKNYLNEQIIIIDRLIEYFNDNLKKVGKVYKCVYPGINKNYRWEYNYETYLRKNAV